MSPSPEPAPAPAPEPAPPYDVGLAWRRAIVYAVACLLIGGATGVLGDIVTEPPVSAAQCAEPWWWLWTTACLAVVVVGYWVVWPMGTLTHGRPLVPSATLFGLMWGIAEGVLFASVWAVADDLAGRWVAVALTFVVLSAYLGLWHQLYWDIKVSPDHNIAEWNARKVVLVHVPNLLVTLPYLAVTGSVGLFVLFQTIGLVGSARAMHFPGFPGASAVLHGENPQVSAPSRQV